jgi:hypothetical protein
MYKIAMLNDASEWEYSVKTFKSVTTAIAYALKHKLREVWREVRYVKIS